MKALNVSLALTPNKSQRVGKLLYQQRKIYFEYDAQWLQNGFALSPFHLQLTPQLLEDKIGLWQGLHGVFNDSLPDGWGLLLMDRQLRKESIDPRSIMPLDRLAWLGSRTMGALTYEPVTGPESDALLVDIHEMAKNAGQIYAGTSEEVLPELFRAGGSPGGARPKALIAIKSGINADQMVTGDGELQPGYTSWLVKFNAKDDFADAGNIEYAYSLMAKDADIDMPETQLLEGRYFAVRRFDREGQQRVHVHTFGNMVGADFRVPTLDYADLLKVVSEVTRDRREVLKGFRQMVFNIATHNRDDHSKNFAFVWCNKDESEVSQGGWKLTPAYDLMFSNGIHGEHTMTIAGEGKSPSLNEITQLAKQAGLEKERGSIVEKVNDVVSKWENYANQTEVSDKSKKTIAKYMTVI